MSIFFFHILTLFSVLVVCLKESWNVELAVMDCFYLVFSGGNCNTGPNAERFLGPKLREHVVACYNFDTEAENIRFGKLLRNLNCIIRVLGSSRRKARPCPY